MCEKKDLGQSETSLTPGLHGSSPLVQGPQETLGVSTLSLGCILETGGKQTWVQNPAPPLIICVILGTFHNLPEALVSYL